MEHILRESSSAEGHEILFFENALIEKIKGNSTSFASIGTLSVLYFKSYDRFVLQINDWIYPLTRRLPIVAELMDTKARVYILPALNDFSYRLTLESFASFQSLTNFERILYANSNFYFKGEETPFRTSEISPDDKLTRNERKHTGLKETVTQTIKTGIEKAKVAGKTIQTGTMHLDSKKHRTLLKDIKNRNYKKRAHSTFQKGFFEVGQKITREFELERKQNMNLLQEKEMKELKTGYHLPRMYINKEELEDAILDNRELAVRGNIHLTGFKGERGRTEEKRGGFMDSLKQGLNDIKHTFKEMVSNSGPRVNESAVGQGPMERHEKPTETHSTMTGIDSMTQHYS